MATHGCDCSTNKPENEQHKENDDLRSEGAEETRLEPTGDYESTVFSTVS